jgi:hypothetical protein
MGDWASGRSEFFNLRAVLFTILLYKSGQGGWPKFSIFNEATPVIANGIAAISWGPGSVPV